MDRPILSQFCVKLYLITITRINRAKGTKTDYGEKIRTNSFVLEPILKEVSIDKCSTLLMLCH